MNRIECDQFGKSVSKCNICDNIFDTKNKLIEHMKTEH